MDFRFAGNSNKADVCIGNVRGRRADAAVCPWEDHRIIFRHPLAGRGHGHVPFSILDENTSGDGHASLAGRSYTGADDLIRSIIDDSGPGGHGDFPFAFDHVLATEIVRIENRQTQKQAMRHSRAWPTRPISALSLKKTWENQ